MDRIQIITERLQQAFSPEKLDVIDDSDKHRGHAGSRDGAGHYTVIITAHCFAGKSRIVVHREIYQVLNDLIPREIHALQIKICSAVNIKTPPPPR
jgi:BolA protein